MVYDKYQYDSTGNPIYNSDLRYIYNTSGGLLLTREQAQEGMDLSNVNSNMSDSWEGPSHLLLKNADGDSFALPDGHSIFTSLLHVKTIRLLMATSF